MRKSIEKALVIVDPLISDLNWARVYLFPVPCCVINPTLCVRVTVESKRSAKELTAKALDAEEKRLGVIKRYIGELSTVLPAKQVARVFQLEMQMQRMIDLQVAVELPLVE